MTVVLDFEKDIEDAFISVLNVSSDIAPTVRRWRDQSSDEVYPSVLVHCSPVTNHEATPVGALNVAIVELGVRTYIPDDKDRATIHNLIGAVRDVIQGSGLVTALNLASSFTFLDRGIDIGEATDITDEREHQISITLTCQITI
ncbi:unnamed protein product [marine sediment metagenome]|uniref:DUF3168 domain-containing protein n=1 Tax=marine sediment metagenome TaxID=412755 RepID=X0S2B5_9ZZZZ